MRLVHSNQQVNGTLFYCNKVLNLLYFPIAFHPPHGLAIKGQPGRHSLTDLCKSWAVLLWGPAPHMGGRDAAQRGQAQSEQKDTPGSAPVRSCPAQLSLLLWAWAHVDIFLRSPGLHFTVKRCLPCQGVIRKTCFVSLMSHSRAVGRWPWPWSTRRAPGVIFHTQSGSHLSKYPHLLHTQ